MAPVLPESWFCSLSEYSHLAFLTSLLNVYFTSLNLSLSPLLNASFFSNRSHLSLAVNQGLSLLYVTVVRDSTQLSSQHPGINFPGKAQQCDTPIFKYGNHHPGLPLDRHCPQLPRDTEEAHQSRQPNNVQSHQHLRANLIHIRRLVPVPSCLLTHPAHT